MRVPALLVATFVLISRSVLAGIIDVPADQPTIAAAVTAASNGDTIRLKKGRYQEAIVTTKSLKFVGKGGAIWDGFFGGTSHAQLKATAANVSVQNIEFQNGTTAIEIAGNGADIVKCRFRAVEIAVVITGANAQISRNRCSETLDTYYMFKVLGPDARIERNSVFNSDGSAIIVDAQNAGGATVFGNVLQNSRDYTHIEVKNAIAPKIVRNRLRDAYLSGIGILAENCDDALVQGNDLARLNYSIDQGIRVIGARARIIDNTVRQLLNYDGDYVGIDVIGADALVAKNAIINCSGGSDNDTWGIRVAGARARISDNDTNTLGGAGDECFGIDVTGDDARIEKNHVRDFTDEYTYGIDVTGNRAAVSKNRVERMLYETSLYITGDDFTIAHNVVRDCAYGVYPIYVTGGATTPGSAVIEDNFISDIGYLGISLTGDDVILRDNRLRNLSGDAFEISGNANRLQDNVATNVLWDGIYLDGDANIVSRCTFMHCGQDGIDVNSGTGNVFDKCKAIDCVAEGFDNGGGTATILTNCTLKGSRIDYAGNNNVANDSGTSFGSGGKATPPEID